MSDKALFVMDMPEKGCVSCVIGRNHSIPLETCIYCPVSGKNAIDKEAEKIPGWCPLKAMLGKLADTPEGVYDTGYLDGWNACIDAILEGYENEKK